MKSNTRSIILALLAAGGLTATTVASAAGESSSTYQRELAVCGHNQQDRAACIREAGAARQAAARGGLTSAPDYRANALARCGLQPPTERSACEARVLGSMGDTRAMVDGSVMGGGVIRESVTTTLVPVVPAPPPEPMPMPMRPMR
ncbi:MULTISPECIES: hypothetical protein [unclassified Variovorax]|jgi:hypothetical protein|uniref:hypothetical protein n=1 Tax=unclassified Variovorax TaxID=663243 RepID=UPI000D11808F|nr:MULTISPECIES: hypothetical protein [unclassified Variovorax]AVQ81966.1 hypothetical protein C4F17_13920 [Variovorax sp. PMC12]QRY33777.1 hypothetical protein JVX96_10980 [Variovorax sp. PDNC026]